MEKICQDKIVPLEEANNAESPDVNSSTKISASQLDISLRVKNVNTGNGTSLPDVIEGSPKSNRSIRSGEQVRGQRHSQEQTNERNDIPAKNCCMIHLAHNSISYIFFSFLLGLIIGSVTVSYYSYTDINLKSNQILFLKKYLDLYLDVSLLDLTNTTLLKSDPKKELDRKQNPDDQEETEKFTVISKYPSVSLNELQFLPISKDQVNPENCFKDPCMTESALCELLPQGDSYMIDCTCVTERNPYGYVLPDENTTIDTGNEAGDIFQRNLSQLRKNIDGYLCSPYSYSDFLEN